MQETIDLQKQAEYILRYYLPVKPHYDEFFTEKRFQELLDFCRKTKVSAVMFYVATNPDFYYMPDTVEYTKFHRDQMLPYIKRLREEGIGYQINFQSLIGAHSGGDDFSCLYGWEQIVDQKGNKARGVACPIGEKFRAMTAVRLRLWAETHPDIIWIDDDFRLHNHRTPGASLVEGEEDYVDYYCFCDEHIARFNQRKGASFTREELVSKILKAGEVSKIRGEYFDFLNETVVDTAAWIEQTVHSVDANICIAQMTSLPDVHTAEGRNWGEFLTALSGATKTVLRPHFGPYREGDPKDFVACYKALGQTIAQITETYSKEVEYCPEIENTRFTVWAKSAAVTSFQLMLSVFMGCNKITLSLYDLDGGSFFDEPAYGRLLQDKKVELDAVAELNLFSAENLGVSILTSGRSARTFRLKQGDLYAKLGGEDRYIEDYLLKMGVPCRYVTPDKLQPGGLTVLDGYSINVLSDSQIRELLKGKVFLDGQATEILCERGFAKEIGIESLCKGKTQVNAEYLFSIKRKDGTNIRVSSRILPNCWYQMQVQQKTKIYSEFITPLNQHYPGLTLFENSLGGKVVIYPARKNWGDGFFTHHRVALFKKILLELDPNLDILQCNNYAFFCVKKKLNGEKFYLVSNFSLDPMEEFLINGKKLAFKLNPYQTAIYADKADGLKLVAKS